MLNPAPITDALASALRGIPEFLQQMSNDSERISAFHYLPGTDYRLAERIEKMKNPETVVAWDATLPGNFDGATIWKHRFNVYVRAGNQVNAADPKSFEYLWWAMVNRPVTGFGQNLRYLNLVSGLDIMETPGIRHMLDENLQDYFCATFVFPEIGDN